MPNSKVKFSKSTMRRNLSVGTIPNASAMTKVSCISNFIQTKHLYSLDLSRNLNLFISSKITKDEYLSLQKDAISKAFRTSFLLGKVYSQTNEVSLSDYENRMISQLVAGECSFMEKFANDVSSGNGKIPYAKRIKMYSDTLTSMFTFGNMAYVPEDYAIYWVLGNTDKHCPTCLSLAYNSPYTKKTLPSVPKSGYTECLGNCRCNLKYDNDNEYLNFVLGNFSTVNGRTKLPEKYEYEMIDKWLSQFYYYRGMYEITKNQSDLNNSKNMKNVIKSYIKFNDYAISLKFPISRYVSELREYIQCDSMELLSDYLSLKSGDVVSIHDKGSQTYAKFMGYDGSNPYCVDISGNRINLNNDSMIVFAEKRGSV